MSDNNITNFVDKATSEYLIGTDWGMNMQLCDYLNNDPGKSKEAIAKVTKKLKSKEPRVLMLALDLLETLVKNCEPVHAFVGNKECQAEIIKLIQNKKTKDDVRERALELVQYWADNFSKRPQFPMYNQTYLLLRKTGVSFPPRRKDEPPLVFRDPAPQKSQSQRSITPTSSYSSSHSQSHSQSYSSSGHGGNSLPAEFAPLHESISLATEMLSFTNVEEEDPNTNDILKDLVQTCKDALPTIRSTIESGNFTSEEAMLEMLSLNDELLKVQEQFEELLVSREHFLKYGPSRPPQRSSAPSSTTSSNSGDLLDLAGDLEKMKVTAMQGGGLDDFDSFFGGKPAGAPPAVTAHPVSVPPYNPFASNSPQQPVPAVRPAPVSAPAASSNAFDEFDMLANRHGSTTPTQPILTPLSSTAAPSTSFQGPSAAVGFGAPVLTPLKPNTPLPPISPSASTSTNYLSTSPNPQQGLMGTSPVRQQGMSPTTAFPNYPNYSAVAQPQPQAYPAYGAPPQTMMMGYPPQPQMMGAKPMAYGVPYGTYTQPVGPYYQQQNTMYPGYQPPK